MSKENKANKQATAENKPAAAQDAKKAKVVENTSTKLVLRQDQLVSATELEQKQARAVLEEVVKQKKAPDMDAQFMKDRLDKAGISMFLSDKLQQTIWDAKRAIATGVIAFLDTKQLCNKVYEQAVADGHSPMDARKIVFIFVADEGRFLTERTVRNYLPAEAKDPSKNRAEQTKAFHERNKTAEEKEGLKQFYCSVEVAREIAKFAERNEGCLVFAREKELVRARAKVTIEVKGKDGKFHKADMTPESAEQAVAAAPKVKTGGKKK